MQLARPSSNLPFTTLKSSLSGQADASSETGTQLGYLTVHSCFREIAKLAGKAFAASQLHKYFSSISRRAAGPLCSMVVPLFVMGFTVCSVASAQYIQSTVTTGLSVPGGVAVDASGNVFIADTYNNRVLKEIRFRNGTYEQITIGSGLSYPEGVAVDGNGNVYIADSGNLRVLKETPLGIGYTQSVLYNYALYGEFAPYGVAVDQSGNVYVASFTTKGNSTDNFYGGVDKLTPSGSYSASVVNRSNLLPTAVAVDESGNVYCNDAWSGDVFKETLWHQLGGGEGYSESIVFSGNGSSFADGATVDGSGNVYIIATDVSTGANSVLKETPQSGTGGYTQSVLNISGLAEPDDLPAGIAVDSSESLYVSDYDLVLKETLP